MPFLLLLDAMPRSGKENYEVFITSAVCYILAEHTHMEKKTIALVIKSAKLDASVLKAAMWVYLNHSRQKTQKTQG